MTRNCVLSEKRRIYCAQRFTFSSSRAASISSITQKGVGRTLRMAKYSAIATKAFSPPESRLMVETALPGGCTRISIPQSRTCSSSSRTKAAFPPPKSSRKVPRKLSSISRNRSMNSFSISVVMSRMMSFSSVRAFSTSSRCPVRKVSMAPRFGFPRSLIWRRRPAISLLAFCRFSTG